MNKRLLASVIGGLIIAGTLTFLSSCGGTSGGEDSLVGDAYVADDSVGSISFATLPSTLPVSQVGGFLISVRNGSGQAVPDMKISCDTELGLALIEPTTGVEMTDSGGYISGKVGCERPGSYQIGCRTPVGANKRTFQRVICSGEVPNGFAGFPGAGGGGLGGGNLISDDGGPGGADIAGFGIISAILSDGKVEETFTVDTTRENVCGDDGNDDEPFEDGKVKFKFLNDSNSSIDCESYTVTVPGVGVYGPISTGILVDSIVVNAEGGEKEVTLPLAIATNLSKVWVGSSDTIPSATGFKNVKFSFSCSKQDGGSGNDFIKSTTLGINFININRCGL